MNLRRSICFPVMAWTVTIALSLSPVMAQSGQDTDGPAKETSNPIVDTSVLPELPLATTAMAFPAVARNSTLPAAVPEPPKPSADVEAPGQSKWVILAAIITAAAITGVILLLRGWGGGKSHPPSPSGTVITAGTPVVTPPSH